MTFYKAVCDDAVIGVATSDALRRHQEKHNILIRAGADDAECIIVNDELYHGKWMKPFAGDFYPCRDAAVLAISEEEYRSLLTPQEDAAPDAERGEDADFALEADPFECSGTDRLTADYAKRKKIEQLSAACRKHITDGFDIQLGEKTMHFAMKASDQLNLNAAALALLGGSTEIPYHADGEKFCLFSAEDMRSILDVANAHRLYHLAYFNSLKAWLRSLTKLSSIQAVDYGAKIPAKYRTAYLKSFAGGGAVMR